MGQYSTYKGEVKFKTQKSFEKFLDNITKLEWYSPENDSWISDGDLVDSDVVDKIKRTITLPDVQIDNFHRVISLFKKGTWEGMITGTSDDGCFEGWVIYPNGKEECYDLEDWAKKNNLPLEWDEEVEDWSTDDKYEVMESFMEDPYPPSNAKKFILKG
jgi:hypothetical protein